MPGALSVDDLRRLADAGDIDTVVVAMCDMQGRLVGKRLHAPYFLAEAAERGIEGCDYLLAVDVDMRPVPGFAMSSWERGYGDLVMAPDLTSLRRLPWAAGTALCLADARWHDGSAVAPSPRQVLRAQLDRLGAMGWRALTATELEFLVFRHTYEEAWHRGYGDLEPASLYNIDYSVLGTAKVEHLLHRLRLDMAGAGLEPESAKGECNRGQHEIVFRYAEALTTADNHVVYKAGAKEIAAQLGMSLTFMAKFDEREGNSCHIHLSLRDSQDQPVFATEPQVFDHFLAGVLATLREFSVLFAPNINSYKRFAAGSFAPTAVAWGRDNRTCALRVVGEGPSLRMEHRVPGGDANPYLALAAVVAGGLFGVENSLPLQPPFEGNAYLARDVTRVPSTLREAAELFDKSSLARAAFGDDVVDHYVNMARVELDSFDATVTDWERVRCFERM